MMLGEKGPPNIIIIQFPRPARGWDCFATKSMDIGYTLQKEEKHVKEEAVSTKIGKNSKDTKIFALLGPGRVKAGGRLSTLGTNN